MIFTGGDVVWFAEAAPIVTMFLIAIAGRGRLTVRAPIAKLANTTLFIKRN